MTFAGGSKEFHKDSNGFNREALAAHIQGEESSIFLQERYQEVKKTRHGPEHDSCALERHLAFLGRNYGIEPCRSQYLDELLDEWASEIHENKVNLVLARIGFPCLPSFLGVNPYDWVEICEEFFEINPSLEAYKYSLVVDLLTGKAREWFFTWNLSSEEADWDEFVEALCTRFENEVDVDKEEFVVEKFCEFEGENQVDNNEDEQNVVVKVAPLVGENSVGCKYSDSCCIINCNCAEDDGKYKRTLVNSDSSYIGLKHIATISSIGSTHSYANRMCPNRYFGNYGEIFIARMSDNKYRSKGRGNGYYGFLILQVRITCLQQRFQQQFWHFWPRWRSKEGPGCSFIAYGKVGQAVTFEDFLAAIRDLNGADFADKVVKEEHTHGIKKSLIDDGFLGNVISDDVVDDGMHCAAVTIKHRDIGTVKVIELEVVVTPRGEQVNVELSTYNGWRLVFQNWDPGDFDPPELHKFQTLEKYFSNYSRKVTGWRSALKESEIALATRAAYCPQLVICRAETNSQKKLSAILMINFLIKCLDSRSTFSKIDWMIEKLSNANLIKGHMSGELLLKPCNSSRRFLMQTVLSLMMILFRLLIPTLTGGDCKPMIQVHGVNGFFSLPMPHESQTLDLFAGCGSFEIAHVAFNNGYDFQSVNRRFGNYDKDGADISYKDGSFSGLDFGRSIPSAFKDYVGHHKFDAKLAFEALFDIVEFARKLVTWLSSLAVQCLVVIEFDSLRSTTLLEMSALLWDFAAKFDRRGINYVEPLMWLMLKTGENTIKLLFGLHQKWESHHIYKLQLQVIIDFGVQYGVS